MHITNITEAKSHFSALIEKVMTGEEIIIGKDSNLGRQELGFRECRCYLGNSDKAEPWQVGNS